MKQVTNSILKKYVPVMTILVRAIKGNRKGTTKKNQNSLLSCHPFIPALFFIHLFPAIGHAAPTSPSSQKPSSTIVPATKVPITTGQTTQNPLSPYCNGEVDYGGLFLDETTKASIASALKKYRKKHPDDKISRCIIKTPDGNAIDEAILSFNEGKLQSEIDNTAFLLLGKGIRASNEKPAEPCHPGSYRFAGDQTAPLSSTQNNWENSYQVKESVTLAAGQKLIGTPLNINNDSLAEGFYVNLRRIISGQIKCRGTELAGFNVDKGNLLTLSQPGVVVSGLTNALDMNERATLSGTCTRLFRFRSYSKSHQGEVDAYLGYQSLIKAEIDPKSLSPEHTHFYGITDNEFFQAQSSAVDIRFKQGADTLDSTSLDSTSLDSTTLDSTKMDNMKSLVFASNNRFYACHAKIDGKNMEPVLAINTYFTDIAENPKFIQALDLTNNQFMTKGDTAIQLAASPNTKSTLKNNHLVTSGLSILDSRGISLTGATRLQESGPEFMLESNTIKGFQDALSLEGALSLGLYSNQLNGRRSAIARVPGQLTDTIKLFGNKENSYSESVTSPCAGLELSKTEGGFLFSNGASCPVNYD